MPIDLIKRIDLDLLFPPFLERTLALLGRCREKYGADYYAISGFRSYQEQDSLYAQGRIIPGRIVTWAESGESAHNFGIAIDLCRDGFLERRGLQPDYRPESYALLGDLAPEFGLVWGGSWGRPDMPHIQWGPSLVTASQLAPLRTEFEAGGLGAAWRYLERKAAVT
jgi:peptidoglycan LD-endopeptidase CwlK